VIAPTAPSRVRLREEPTVVPSRNGHDRNTGRFLPGNKGGPGNPLGVQVQRLRRALLDAVTEGDIVDVIRALVRSAKGGDVAAAKVVLLYACGRPEYVLAISEPDEPGARDPRYL
jgi:hypothetical protein